MTLSFDILGNREWIWDRVFPFSLPLPIDSDNLSPFPRASSLKPQQLSRKTFHPDGCGTKEIEQVHPRYTACSGDTQATSLRAISVHVGGYLATNRTTDQEKGPVADLQDPSETERMAKAAGATEQRRRSGSCSINDMRGEGAFKNYPISRQAVLIGCVKCGKEGGGEVIRSCKTLGMS